MGTLIRFKLPAIGCDTLVETGCGLGWSINWALHCGLTVYSVDECERLVAHCREKYPQANVTHGLSTPWLRDTWPEGKVLYWLDAHLSGGIDQPAEQYIASGNRAHSWPLLDELSVLSKRGLGSDDVVIIDDAAMYFPALCTHSIGAPFDRSHEASDLNGLLRVGFPRHEVKRFRVDTGYVIIVPPGRYGLHWWRHWDHRSPGAW